MYTITKKDQIKELTNRIPPMLNIDLVIFKKGKNNIYVQPEFLVGKKDLHINFENKIEWIFSWGRMCFNEIREETINRRVQKEIPWIVVKIKKIITAIADKWYNHRRNGVTMEYLLEY